MNTLWPLPSRLRIVLFMHPNGRVFHNETIMAQPEFTDEDGGSFPGFPNTLPHKPNTRTAEPANMLDDLPTYHNFTLRRRLRIMTSLLILLILVGLLLAIRANKIQFDQVISESMEPTLKVGDILITDSNALPGRYDLVIACEPENPNDRIVKRIMGLPGDLIVISGDAICVNGQEEFSATVRANFMTGWDLKVRVPENHLFLLGDNRDESYDSRNYGTVPCKFIHGVVYGIIWPLTRIGRPDPPT